MAMRFTLEGNKNIHPTNSGEEYFYDLDTVLRLNPTLKGLLYGLHELSGNVDDNLYISKRGYIGKLINGQYSPVAQLVAGDEMNGEIEYLYGFNDFTRANPKYPIKQYFKPILENQLNGDDSSLYISNSGTVYTMQGDKLSALGILDSDENRYSLNGLEGDEELNLDLAGFKFKMPKFKMKMPKLKFKAPKLKMPKLKFKAPKMPKFKFKAPKFKLKLPKLKMPKLKLPNLKMPKLPDVGKALSDLAKGAGDLVENLLSNEPGGMDEAENMDESAEEGMDQIDEGYDSEMDQNDLDYSQAEETVDDMETEELDSLSEGMPEEQYEEVLEGISSKYDLIRDGIDRIYLGRCNECENKYNNNRQIFENAILETANNLNTLSGELGMFDFSSIMNMASGGGGMPSFLNQAQSQGGRANMARNMLKTGAGAMIPGGGMIADMGLNLFDKAQAAKRAKKLATQKRNQNIMNMLLKKHAPQFAPRKTIKPVKIYKPKPKPKKKIKVKKPSIQYAANVATQVYPGSQTQSWGSNNPASENYIEDVSNIINPPAPAPAPNVVNPVSNVQPNSNNNTTIIIAGAALAGVALVMMGKKGK